MTPSDFAKADVEDVLINLTTEEAILLTAGVGFWHTHAVERLGVPAVKVSDEKMCLCFLTNLNGFQVSDGPNGLRGNHFFMGTPAKCLPVSSQIYIPLSMVLDTRFFPVINGSWCDMGHEVSERGRIEASGPRSKIKGCLSDPCAYLQYSTRESYII